VNIGGEVMLLCYPAVFVGRDRRIWRVLNDTMTVVVRCGGS
jgi:hypothetical protein